MMDQFYNWLAQNNLSEAFTTSAGDSLYVNREKMFGVIYKMGELGAHSFYFDDIVECKMYDDNHLIADWSSTAPWQLYNRSTRHSTKQLYMNIRFKDNHSLRLQIFRSTNGNVIRGSLTHINLLNYGCQIAQILYNCCVNCQ